MVVLRCCDEFLALERHARRKDVVGILARVGHPHVHVDDELHLREGVFDPTAAVGAVMYGIARHFDEALVLAFLGRLEEVAVLDEDGLVRLAAVGEDDRRVVEAERPAARLDFARDAAGGAAQVAREHAEQVERTIGVALVLVAHAESADDERRAMRRVLLAELDRICRGNARNRLLVLGRIGRDVLFEQLECRLVSAPVELVAALERRCALVFLGALRRRLDGTGLLVPVVKPALVASELARLDVNEQRGHRVLLHERAVVLAALDDLACHAQRERRIAAGLDRDKPVGITRRGVEQQADVYDFCPTRLGLDDVLRHALLVFHRIAAPDDEVACRIELDGVDHHVLVEVAQVEVRRVIRAVIETVGVERVGAAPQATQPVAQQRVESLRRRKRGCDVPKRDGVMAVLLAKLEHLGANLVERLIPADTLPLALATFAGTLERVQQPVVSVHLTPRCGALLAAMSLAGFRAGVVDRLGTNDLAIGNDGLDCTKLMVAPPGTCRAYPFFLRHLAPFHEHFVHARLKRAFSLSIVGSRLRLRARKEARST